MKFTLVFSLTLLTIFSFGQDYQADYSKYSKAKDTLNQRLTLEKWAKADPTNPDLLAKTFRYTFGQSQKSFISMDPYPTSRSSMQMTNDSGKVFYLNDITQTDSLMFLKATNIAKNAVSLYPNRLDIWFGLAYVYGSVEDWVSFTKTVTDVLEVSSKNDNKWLWTENEEKDQGQEFLLSNIQTYQLQIYNTEDDSLLKHMATIAETVLKHYPNHVESLSNLAIVNIILKNYPEAISSLKRAEEINPKDYIVLGNIAETYSRMGDKSNAMSYYEKMLKHGDEQAKTQAREAINKLKD